MVAIRSSPWRTESLITTPAPGFHSRETKGKSKMTNFAPKLYSHGTATCDCISGEGVTVMERTDEGLMLRFDGDERVWPLGWAAYLSGRFVKFSQSDLEPAPWIHIG